MLPLHVCFLNRSYHPDLGATGQLLTELAEGLVREHGCRVSVVAGRPTTGEGLAPADFESHNGVDIWRVRGTTLDKRRFLGRAANYLTYVMTATWRAFRIPRPDVYVALTDPPIIGLTGWAAARLRGSRFVFLCQDVFPEVARLLEDFRSPALDALLQIVNRFLVRAADRIVALGDSMKRRLIDGKGADANKVVVIHNWADASRLRPGPKANSFSIDHGLDDKFVVMHSGNLGLSQNLENLVSAAERLRDRDDIRFVLVGDGVKKRTLEKRAEELDLKNVLFLPYQAKERLPESFATADVFVVGLKSGLAGYIVPSKLYGILAAGRPFVAAVDEDGEPAAIARDHACGLLAEPGRTESLVARLLELYLDPSLRRRLGRNARQAALEFDRERQVARYHETLRAVVAPSNAP